MTTQKELRKLCVEKGIKYSSLMNKKTMCEKLGIEYQEPVQEIKVILKNVNTGEERKYFKIGDAAKDFKVNPGNICYFSGREMLVNGEKWFVQRLDEIKPRNRKNQKLVNELNKQIQ